jgi:hypothetical protein
MGRLCQRTSGADTRSAAGTKVQVPQECDLGAVVDQFVQQDPDDVSRAEVLAEVVGRDSSRSAGLALASQAATGAALARQFRIAASAVDGTVRSGNVLAAVPKA